MFWSDSLERAFLHGSDAAPELREALARGEADARRTLALTWRRSEERLVRAVERTPVELVAGALEDLSPLASDGSTRTVVLALLSEVHEDTRDDVELILEGLGDLPVAAEFRAAWEELRDGREPDQRPSVLVVGGRKSENERIDELAARHGFDVSWIPVTRGKGRAAAERSLDAQKTHDCVVVVTGRIGHPLMFAARGYAESRSIPCYFVERLSRRRLDAVAREIEAAQSGANERSGVERPPKQQQ